MSLKFFYAPMSTATLTQLVLAELDVPHEAIKVDLGKGDAAKAELLAVNPNGKVPTIVHDGTAIWESSAISIYLGEMFGVDKGLWPAQGPRRGEAIKWVCWSNVTVGDAVYRWARNTQDWGPADQKNEKAGEAGKADLAGCLQIVDDALGKSQYLAGDSYTLADTHLHSYLDWVRHMKFDFTPYKHLNAWAERCAARPVYQKIMAEAYAAGAQG
jgi:glutathione S-transferase